MLSWQITKEDDDETLPIKNKPKHPRKGNPRNKMEGPTSKKTKEPPKRANHNSNIKFLKPPPIVRSISNKERGGLPERMPSLDLHPFQ
jgi:hypothetical protein